MDRIINMGEKMRMTILESAKYWKRDRRTIERWIKTGRLKTEILPSGRKLIIGVNEIG